MRVNVNHANLVHRSTKPAARFPVFFAEPGVFFFRGTGAGIHRPRGPLPPLLYPRNRFYLSICPSRALGEKLIEIRRTQGEAEECAGRGRPRRFLPVRLTVSPSPDSPSGKTPSQGPGNGGGGVPAPHHRIQSRIFPGFSLPFPPVIWLSRSPNSARTNQSRSVGL